MEDGFGNGLEPINWKEYWSMIGFSCYSYEGIGIIMPIMDICDCPEQFDKILTIAFILLTTTYVLYSNFCYAVIGDKMTEIFIV